MSGFYGGSLLAANSLSELAALGATYQQASLRNLGLADVNGALTLSAWGSNQNITLTPSGTGALQVFSALTGAPSATNKGLAMFACTATNQSLQIGAYTGSPYAIFLQNNDRRSGTASYYPLVLQPVGSGVLVGTTVDNGAMFQVNGTATFAGTIQPQLATTAGAPAYVKGSMYFDTTLNKLRVGGASAWETITSS